MSEDSGEMPACNATLAIAARNQIGEAPVWDPALGRLTWVDHAAGSVHVAVAAGDGWRESRRWTLGRHVAAALPAAAGGWMVVGAADVTRMDEEGRLHSPSSAPFNQGTMRFNEAKCDALGRLWAGAMALDLTPQGALFCLERDGSWRTILNHAVLPNGMDWSPDGRTFYFIDSIKRTVDAFSFDVVSGDLSAPRTLIAFDDVRGAPNGMCVDTDGCLWVALTCTGQVVRVSPQGERLSHVSISVPGVTSCAFGGEYGDVLFITSRSGRVPAFAERFGVRETEMESRGPEAGGVFACRPGATGSFAKPFMSACGSGQRVGVLGSPHT